MPRTADWTGPPGTPVQLNAADSYLRRITTETLRLQTHLTVIEERITRNIGLLCDGLTDRNLTKLDLDGLVLHRTATGDVRILTTGKWR